MNIRIGTKRTMTEGPRGFTVANIEKTLIKHGFQCKILACGLADFARFTVDQGFTKGENTLSLAGRYYLQTATLEIHRYHGREKLLKSLLEQMHVDILDPLGNTINKPHRRAEQKQAPPPIP